MSVITVLGQGGVPVNVSNSFGLGIRQHDDVMLAYGFSYFTRHQVSIPGGQFLVIRLNVNDVNQHHAEERVVRNRTESCQLKIYNVTGQEGLFPASPQPMPIHNQKDPTLETPNPSGVPGQDLLGEFFYYTPQASNPFAALTPIDDVPLWIASQNPANTRPDTFPAVKGRHYTPGDTYAVVLENLNGSATEVYYQYDWHEY